MPAPTHSAEKPIRVNRFIFNLLRKLLALWVRVTCNNSSLEELGIDPSKPVCYVMHHRSLSDLLVLEQEALKANLPRPYHNINSGGIYEDRAFFFLCQPQGMILQRDRVHHSERLVRLLKAVSLDQNKDVQIVPVSLFWGRAPSQEQSLIKLLFDYNYNIVGGFKKFLAILLHGRNVRLHLDKPLSLRQLVDEGQDQERTLRKLNRVLRVHFRQVKTSVVGPDLSHRRTLVQGILESDPVQEAILHEARTAQLDPQQAAAKARKYAEEIVSDYRSPVVRVFDIVLTWFWNKIYSGVEVEHAEQLQELARDHSIIYTPCHRSHIDYLLLSYVLYYHGLRPPHIAAGINLNMPLVGTLLRRGGAFFMRRSFRGNQLYASVFNEYLHVLFTRGFPVEYFVEGGRSRTGRTLRPRTGMLSMTMQSYLRDQQKSLALVPVYIGYEKVLEGATYLGELRGKEKKKESPLAIIRTVMSLKKSFGKVNVNFGDPIILSEFLDQNQPGWTQGEYHIKQMPTWLQPTVQKLGDTLAAHINGAVAVNPVNLVATALLAMPRQAMDKESLCILLESYLQLLAEVPYSEKMTLPESSPEEMIRYVQKLELVNHQSDALGEIISVEGNKAVLMTYYRNNIQHLFVLPAFILCMFQNNPRVERELIIKLTKALYPYLRAELFLRWELDELEPILSQWLDALVVLGLLERQGNEYLRPDVNSEEFFRLTVISRAISQTLERFYMVASVLLQHGSGRIDKATLEERCRNMAQRLSFLHGINAPEFSDKALFRQFVARLMENNVLEQGADELLHFDQRISNVLEDARIILTPGVRHSIRHIAIKPVTSSDDERKRA